MKLSPYRYSQCHYTVDMMLRSAMPASVTYIMIFKYNSCQCHPDVYIIQYAILVICVTNSWVHMTIGAEIVVAKQSDRKV